MTTLECPREQDVINAIVTGRWPDQCDEALCAHAAECAVCKELVEVTSVMRLDRDGLHEEMSLPSAGQVWWRAAIRARLEASQRVAQPMSWIFGISLACAAGLAIAVVQLLWSPMQIASGSSSPAAWAAWLDLVFTRLLVTFTNLGPLTMTGVFVLLGAAACLLLAPLALYFALSDE
jgi:anti-sigma factor RsiW